MILKNKCLQYLIRCFTGYSTLLFLGCSTQLTVLPDVAQYSDPPQVLVRGKIIYEGNPAYLPRTVEEAKDNVGPRILVKYTLDEGHIRADYVVIGSGTHKLLKMQSSSGGTHIGEKGWTIAAILEVLAGDKLIQEYTALAFSEGHGQFGDTLTEMRKKALLAVRQNIESQMRGDAEVLQQRVKELR